MSNSTYIVIEVGEQESVVEIINFLITQQMKHRKTRFTCTNDLQEYASEREKLRNTLTASEPPAAKRPAPIQIEEEDIKPIAVFNQQPHPPAFQHDGGLSTYPYPEFPSNPSELPSQPPTTSDRSPMQTQQANGKLVNSYQCTMCSTYIKVRGFDYYKRGAHAIIHTNIMRYECTEPECTFKVRHRADMARHMRTVHHMELGDYKVKECMTEADHATLREYVCVCFPEMADRVYVKRPQKRDTSKPNEDASDQDDMDDDYDNDEA